MALLLRLLLLLGAAARGDDVEALQRSLSEYSRAYESRTGVRPRNREHWGEKSADFRRLGDLRRERAEAIGDGVDGLIAGTAADGTDMTMTGALSKAGCYAPVAEGGWGFCGPLSCKDSYITCPADGGGPATVGGVTGSYINIGGKQVTEATCVPYYDRSELVYTPPDYLPKGPCTNTCTQQKTGVCSGAFLASVFAGTGVKHAFCNDKWLIIASDRSAGGLYEFNLNDPPFPPGAIVKGEARRTGMLSLSLDKQGTLFYPLDVTELTTADLTNNADVLDGDNMLPGLPVTAEGVGMALNGMSDPTTAEASWCLYGPSNYTDGSAASHPPVAPFLDACGGHVHDASSTDAHGFDLGAVYHYHTQVFDAACDSLMCTAGEAYKVSTTGPFQCFKSDLSAAPFGNTALLLGSNAVGTTCKTSNEMSYRCCGMTDYYVINGLEVSDASSTFAPSSLCTVPADPDHGAYESSGSCAVGETLYSGNTRGAPSVTCDVGYRVSGTTRCVKGALTEPDDSATWAKAVCAVPRACV
ncbi:hypothetical protein M885DRAFT_625307 [Pelagophyceae sp. CCMP2097]|nr:hypothetical protein M885DRAFT_625307 [Pelagophyceae sp. CCMP2097]